ncbi:MAG: hypothetical protein OXC26_15400 [Albidovulum sp.]|nr:hypothetical protein [Albidovulum sp.]
MLGCPVPDASGVPASAGQAEGYEQAAVLDLEARRIYNEMMERKHPSRDPPGPGGDLRRVGASWLVFPGVRLDAYRRDHRPRPGVGSRPREDHARRRAVDEEAGRQRDDPGMGNHIE